MNIQQAKQIPVQKIAEHFSGRFSHQKGTDAWYYSPFRPDERTASFKINEKLNTWYDFAEGKGGSTLDLWLDINRQDRKNSEALKSALKALEPFAGTSPADNSKRAIQRAPERQETAFKNKQPEYRFKLLKKPGKIWMDSLKDEIPRRGLNMATVSQYLKQAYFKDLQTKKEYNGFAFPNDKGGYEISIPNPRKGESFKTNIGDKAPTSFVHGSNDKAVIFEGFWDFLTWVQMTTKINDYEIFVLNSLSFINEVAGQIITHKDTIKSVFLFLDNDTAGEKGLDQMAAVLEPEGFTIGSMNHQYEGFKDLNDCWVKDPTAKQRLKPTTNQIKAFSDTAWNQVQQKNKASNKL